MCEKKKSNEDKLLAIQEVKKKIQRMENIMILRDQKIWAIGCNLNFCNGQGIYRATWASQEGQQGF